MYFSDSSWAFKQRPVRGWNSANSRTDPARSGEGSGSSPGAAFKDKLQLQDNTASLSPTASDQASTMAVSTSGDAASCSSSLTFFFRPTQLSSALSSAAEIPGTAYHANVAQGPLSQVSKATVWRPNPEVATSPSSSDVSVNSRLPVELRASPMRTKPIIMKPAKKLTPPKTVGFNVPSVGSPVAVQRMGSPLAGKRVETSVPSAAVGTSSRDRAAAPSVSRLAHVSPSVDHPLPEFHPSAEKLKLSLWSAGVRRARQPSRAVGPQKSRPASVLGRAGSTADQVLESGGKLKSQVVRVARSVFYDNCS